MTIQFQGYVLWKFDRFQTWFQQHKHRWKDVRETTKALCTPGLVFGTKIQSQYSIENVVLIFLLLSLLLPPIKHFSYQMLKYIQFFFYRDFIKIKGLYCIFEYYLTIIFFCINWLLKNINKQNVGDRYYNSLVEFKVYLLSLKSVKQDSERPWSIQNFLEKNLKTKSNFTFFEVCKFALFFWSVHAVQISC